MRNYTLALAKMVLWLEQCRWQSFFALYTRYWCVFLDLWGLMVTLG